MSKLRNRNSSGKDQFLATTGHRTSTTAGRLEDPGLPRSGSRSKVALEGQSRNHRQGLRPLKGPNILAPKQDSQHMVVASRTNTEVRNVEVFLLWVHSNKKKKKNNYYYIISMPT